RAALASGARPVCRRSASAFADAVSADMMWPINCPRTPVGQRDCRAMKPGRRIRGSPLLITQRRAQTENVGHARPDDPRREPDGEAVHARYAASADDDAVAD